ncbi:MAG: hypothetical protein KDA24_00460 [Deltaproteobacteria bacterium]|nr:hypothetical protein [Deltaproteobacteria bacterium]
MLAFLGAALPSAAAEELPNWSVEIDATVQGDDGTIAGRAHLTVWNPTQQPLSSIRLFLYPEHYRAKPALDDILWERVYPGIWEPGGMSLGFVRHLREDGGTSGLTWRRIEDGPPMAEVDLPGPLLPGESTTLEIPFLTQVPRKYGTFGRARGILTASGGWHPMPVTLTPEGEWVADAAPPPADYSIQLTTSSAHAVVLGDAVDVPRSRTRLGADFVPTAAPLGGSSTVTLDGDARRTHWSGKARWVGVTVHRRATQRDIPLEDGSTVTWVGRPLSKPQVRWIRRAAHAVRRTEVELGLEVEPRDVLLLEAPLRRRLVEEWEGALFVSDRYLEAEAPFWRYHDVHLARALLAHDMESLIQGAEPPRMAPFVLEALSWELVGDYLQTRWKNHVGLRNLLQRFSFFPQVETLLETPAFPFADQIFDNPWIVDPLSADIRRFNRPLRSGRTLSLRLDDRVGTASKRQSMLRYLRGQTSRPLFVAMAADAGQEIDELANSWLGSVPRVDFQLETIERDRTEGGLHRTTVTARRVELEGVSPDEVVEVRLSPGHGRTKGRVTLRWTGSEEVATWEVLSRRRMHVVEIDPQARLTELDENGLNLRQDNRRPGLLRVSGFGYAGLSITGRGFEAYGLLNIRPRHSARHQVNLRAFTNEQSLAGGGVTYAHYFGPPRWGLNLKHRVVFTVDVSLLNQNFRETDAPLLSRISAGYVYETRSNSMMPTKGGRFSVTVTGGRDFSLKKEQARSITEAGFIGLDVQAIRLLKLHPHHVLALRGKAGFVLGEVEHSRITLGGNADLRGIPERAVLTPARVLGVVEWRHLFFKDADIPLPFQRVRGLQGGLFIEGALAAKGFDEAPGVEDLHFSVGYGFRWFVDWLGVLPGAWGMDFAYTPGTTPGRLPIGFFPEDWPEVPFQVYFVGSQSF